MSGWRRRAGAATLVCVALIVAPFDGAAAEPDVAATPGSDDVAAAEAGFAEGRRLLAEGKTAEACAIFAAAHARSPLPGIQLNLAHCHEMQGQLRRAVSEYVAALEVARSSGRRDRMAFAEERMAIIERRLARVRLRVAAPVRRVEGLEVYVAGELVPPGRFDAPVLVEPGMTIVEARATGRVPFVEKVQLGEGENASVDVADLRRASTRVLAATDAERAADERHPGWLRPAGWSAVVLGALTLGAGVVAGSLALAEESAAEDAGCRQSACPNRDALSRSRTANDAATAANILVPAGLAVGGAGVAVLVAFD